MGKHIVWMIIGCSIPLLLIFFAPTLGLSNNWSLFIFIIAMFACHLLMPHYGGHGQNNKNENSETKKQNSHEHTH